jgi:hypothetical protein
MRLIILLILVTSLIFPKLICGGEYPVVFIHGIKSEGMPEDPDDKTNSRDSRGR